MGYFLAVITSLLALFFGYSLYVKKKDLVVDPREAKDLEGSMSVLLTDFNRVSNTNINVLEDKIKDLREVIELADDKIRRLNGIMADLEILSSRVKKGERAASRVNLTSTPSVTKQYKHIRQLTSKGISTPGIAKELDISSEDVQLVLNAKNRRVH